MKEIQIPQSQNTSTITLNIEKNMIVVGANGSGKSRLGSKLEQINNPSKRISAQRYLQLNELVQKQDFETADNALKSVYKNQSSIAPQNDYQQVLMSLFAQESKRDSDYVVSARISESKLNVPSSVKEEVIDVWNFIFPYRKLKLDRDRVRAINESSEFSGAEMSDGEKVGLYLISQILLAERNCILIIDEPELHLHKALMVRLWNKLEEYRNDCTFIYITHDLDFAVNKPTNKIIWVQSYTDGMWNWKEIDANEVIPENLFLEMLGSRKPILFVEGEKGSIDIQVYQTYYDDFTIIPRGTCEKVIESVKGLKNNADLHDKKVYGLIDRDFRSEEQLNLLKADGIFSILLNEVENLFLLPDVIQVVCEYLSKTDKKDIIISQIRDIYETNKAHVEFSASKSKIYGIFNEKFGNVKNNTEYATFKENIVNEMDQELASPTLPNKEGDIIEILKVYPHKGLVKLIQGNIELTKNGYKNLVLSILSSEKRQKILDIFKVYLPAINIS